MKILYISTVFPKEEENSTIYTDLVEELIKKGDQVTVVTIEKNLKPFQYKTLKERGATVFRCGCFPIYNVNFLLKGIGIVFLSFFLERIIRKINIKNFDLLLYEVPPITLEKIIRKIKKHYQIKTFLMLKDIFPQNAVDIGLMKKNSFIFKYFKRKEESLYDVSDYIGCMSKENVNYILKHNPKISKEKVGYFPNTKKDNGNKDIDFELKKEKLQFVYGGNMGLPQGVLNIAPAISSFKNEKDIEFIFIGRGTERDKISEYFKEQKNVKVLENLPREEYEKLLSNCDAGFIFLDSRFIQKVDQKPAEKIQLLPSLEQVKKNLLAASGTVYVWGGSWWQGIPEIEKCFGEFKHKK